MVTFRNNINRRNNFRRNDRNFKPTGDRPKYGSNFSNNENFQRKVPGRNNHNASKLIEKYNDLARDALTSGDKILSENYFQHADHFTRILNEQESFKKARFPSESKDNKDITGSITEEKKDLTGSVTEEKKDLTGSVTEEKKDLTGSIKIDEEAKKEDPKSKVVTKKEEVEAKIALTK